MDGRIAAICMMLTAFALLFAHYFPWGALPGRNGRPLHPIAAYVIGVLGILTWPMLSVYVLDYPTAARDAMMLVIITTSTGGIVVAGAYIIDALIERYHERQDGRDAERIAEENP